MTSILHHPALQVFHWVCFSAMVLMTYDPNISTWAAGWASGMVTPFGNTPEAIGTLAGAFTGKAAGATAASAVVPPIPIDPHAGHMMMGKSLG